MSSHYFLEKVDKVEFLYIKFVSLVEFEHVIMTLLPMYTVYMRECLLMIL